MQKVLLLCAHRPNRSPSQRYRFEQYLNFLDQNGFQFTWSFLLNEKEDLVFYSQGSILRKMFILAKTFFLRLKDVFRYKQFDIIFIQREAHFLGISYFEKKAYASGAKVIFDFDDSIWLKDTSPGNKKWEWLKKPEKFLDNIKFAHLVLAGNEYLADKSRSNNLNTCVIPTTINTDAHYPQPELRNGEAVTIGWSGSLSTIKHFEIIVEVLEQIKSKYGDKVRFKVLGPKNYINHQLDISSIEWTPQNEVSELNTFDIGLMPLPNDEWSRGKCGLKGISYLACGVATIMSKVGVNEQIIETGVNGFLADKPGEWLEKISLLIENREMRENMGKVGRESVVNKYSVKANENKYLQAFRSVLNNSNAC